MSMRNAGMIGGLGGAIAVLLFTFADDPDRGPRGSSVRTPHPRAHASPPPDPERILASALFGAPRAREPTDGPGPAGPTCDARTVGSVVDHEVPGRSLALVDVGARVVLVRGEPRLVRLPCEETGPAARAPPPASPPSRVQRLAPTRFAVPLRIVDEIRDGTIHVRARLFPTGRGFRLAGVRRGSIEDELGLENGDEILTVNGRAATDTASMLDLARSIGTAQTIVVTLERRGEVLALGYVL